MSVSSILAFVLAGVAAKAKSVQVARPSKDRIAELEARVAELEADIGAANELARRDQELIDRWRERALANVPAVIAAPQQNWTAMVYGNSLLGAQNLNAELWCNCVPARHDMFLRGE